MSIAELYNSPRPNDLPSREYWLFANFESHNNIIDAIRTQRKIILVQYILWPVDEAGMQNFFLRHQQGHNDFDTILGIAGSDYTDLNFNDPAALEQTFYLHYQEHQKAHQILGI